MKNLIITKIALGVFLAGYAASGAFAATYSTASDQLIQGSKPVIKSGSTEHKFTSVKIYDKNNPSTEKGSGVEIVVGDIIEIIYTLEDENGDDEKVNKTTALSGTFTAYWDGTSKVKQVTVSDGEATVVNGVGTIKFPIPADFDGATRIGFTIIEGTDYGYPRFGERLEVGDIINSSPIDTSTPNTDTDTGNLSSGESGKAPNNSSSGTGGSGSGAGPTPSKPIAGAGLEVRIFADAIVAGDGNLTTGYTRLDGGSSSVIPKQGQSYFAEVVHTNGVDINKAASDSSSYTYIWTVYGKNEKAYPNASDSITASETTLLVTAANEKNQVINLPLENSLYKITNSSNVASKAGAQGFKLKVTATK